MNWKNNTINLGNIKENSKHILTYESVTPLDIINISPGCTPCTSIKGYKNNNLTVEYKVSKIPIHLKKNPGYQQIIKTIVVTYKDGSKEVLIFTAKIIKK